MTPQDQRPSPRDVAPLPGQQHPAFAHQSAAVAPAPARPDALLGGGPGARRGLSDSYKQSDHERREPSNHAASRGIHASQYLRSQTVERNQSRLVRMRKAVKIGAQEHQDLATPGFRVRPLFVTLTYRPGVEWQANHLKDSLGLLRVWLRRRGHALRYVAVAELQKRGAVHYHLVIWWPARLRMPAPDRSGIWPHGLSNVQRARHPVAYLAKYASKGTQGGTFPRGLRLHSCGGLPEAQRVKRSFLLLPGWVREAAGGVVQRVRRGPLGVGGRVMESGELVRSPWMLLKRAQDWSWVLLVRFDTEPEAPQG